MYIMDKIILYEFLFYLLDLLPYISLLYFNALQSPAYILYCFKMCSFWKSIWKIAT